MCVHVGGMGLKNNNKQTKLNFFLKKSLLWSIEFLSAQKKYERKHLKIHANYI